MGFIDLASSKSVSRGYGYYSQNKVISVNKISDTEYDALVQGSKTEPYKIHIDLAHPRKSSHCTCPHAAGKQIVCKHMVAAYFAVFPQEAKETILNLEMERREIEMWEEERDEELVEFLNRMTKGELIDLALNLFDICPKYVVEDFLMENYYDDEEEYDDDDYDGDDDF